MTTNADLIAESHQAEVKVLAMTQGKDTALGVSVVKTIQRLADALETQLAATRVPAQGGPSDDREAILRKALEHVREVGESGLAGPYVHDLPKDVDSNWGWLQTMWPVVVAVDIALASRATVPDAATEELRPSEMTAEETIKLVLKRPGMYGLVPHTEHRSMKAERDAALAAVERLRAIHKPTMPGFGPKSCQSDGRAWPCPTVAALDGVPEPVVKP